VATGARRDAVIYLLGGPPCCGKTTVARQLARASGSAWMHTDYLATAFAAYAHTDDASAPQLALPPGMPRERRNDARYARYTATEVVAHYRALAGRAWPGLRAIIEYALFDGESLVLEGFHFDPALLRDWLAGDGAGYAGDVMPVFLVREEPTDIERALRRGGHARDWVTTQTRDGPSRGRGGAFPRLRDGRRPRHPHRAGAGGAVGTGMKGGRRGGR